VKRAVNLGEGVGPSKAGTHNRCVSSSEHGG